ncbi:MAG: DUF1376 domain-containing protein, partial [Rhodospirillaceae bacterium]
DLTAFPYMPLDVARLRNSAIVSHVSAEGFRAAVLLWCAAWHNKPASSLENDDLLLARYAGFGNDLEGWKRVKVQALHGFVLCCDAKWYHRVIAEKALQAWESKLANRQRTAAATQKRWQSDNRNGQRNGQRNAIGNGHVTDSVTDTNRTDNNRKSKSRAPAREGFAKNGVVEYDRMPVPSGNTVPDAQWRKRVESFAKSGFWLADWGFKPDDPSCYAPNAILAEFGFNQT